MYRIYMILFTFLCSLGHAAEVYRWVGERGITQYGETPPADRPAKAVNARPAAASVDAEGNLLPPPKLAPRPPQVALVPPAPPPPPVQQVRGMDFGVYMHLRRGMSEGELLLRAGKPDQETVDAGRQFVVKSLYYYPTLSDPHITVVTVRGGRIADIERTRKTF